MGNQISKWITPLIYYNLFGNQDSITMQRLALTIFETIFNTILQFFN